ncbi:MAG: amiloride-sensitive sodium channel family protein [Cyanobacteria bacterium J06649_11]
MVFLSKQNDKLAKTKNIELTLFFLLLLYTVPKQSLQEKVEEYSSSFSIHGLSRTIHTDSMLERIFWILALLMALCIAFFMVRSLLQKFFTKDVYVESKSVITTENTFPAVTICTKPFPETDLFCGNKAYENLPFFISPSCNQYGYWNNIGKKNSFKPTIDFARGIGYAEVVTQFDMVFVCPARGNCNIDYLMPDYFAVSESAPYDCLVWNYNGNFNNTNNVVDLVINRLKYSLFYLYVHGHDEDPVHIPRPIPVSTKMNTEIYFEKKVWTKLKRNPPNDCVSKIYNNSKIIFPGKYTRESCVDSFKCMKALEKCGDVLDMCKTAVPVDALEKYWQNKSLSEKNLCLREGYLSKMFDATVEDCPELCEHTKYTVSSSNYQREDVKTDFVLSFSYKEKNKYESEVEKEIYSWEDFVSGIGGMIGLFCGFSILSIAELFVCIGLKIVSLFGLCSSKAKPTSQPQTDVSENKGIENETMELGTPPKEKQSNDDVDEKLNPRIVTKINVNELV